MQNQGNTCLVDGCEKSAYCRGLCKTHYTRFRRHGDPLVFKKPNVGKYCTDEDCGRIAKVRGMCLKHYQQWHVINLAGQCHVIGCTRPIRANGFCGSHYETWRATGSTDPVAPRYAPYVCSRCKKQKEPKDFSLNSTIKRGHQYWCTQCITEARRERGRPLESASARHKYKLRSYGLTPEMYDTLYELQEGCCAICGVWKEPWQPNFGKESRERCLAVDHNHTTGKVRGLVCNNCNHGLGKFKDNISLLLLAVSYLQVELTSKYPRSLMTLLEHRQRVVREFLTAAHLSDVLQEEYYDQSQIEHPASQLALWSPQLSRSVKSTAKTSEISKKQVLQDLRI